MATFITTGKYYDSSGTTVLGTFDLRFTYTLDSTTYPDRSIFNVTKVEVRDNYANSTRLGASYVFYYYDSQTTGIRSTASLSYGTYSAQKGVWVTHWTGSFTVTTYRKEYQTDIYLSAGATYSLPIPPAESYSITFAGGDNLPPTQQKYYGLDTRLSTVVPTKTGHVFINWLSSYDSKEYYPGDAYTLNSPTTMTAQWEAGQYTVSYNANGGTGVTPSQTKSYNVPLNFQDGSTLSYKDLINSITREYELISWNTMPDGSGTTYALSSAIPNITSDLTLYAIWSLKYLYPKLSSLQDYRTATSSLSDKDRAANGEYIYLSFDFVGCSDDSGLTYKVPDCTILIDEDLYTPTLVFDSGEHSGSYEFKPNVIYTTNNPHNITVRLEDPDYSDSSYVLYDYITTSIFPLDLFDNDETNEVYMGIMHPHKPGVPLMLPTTTTDGDIDIHGDISQYILKPSEQTPTKVLEIAPTSTGIVTTVDGDLQSTINGDMDVDLDGGITLDCDVNDIDITCGRYFVNGQDLLDINDVPRQLSLTYMSNSYITNSYFSTRFVAYKVGHLIVMQINALIEASIPQNSWGGTSFACARINDAGTVIVSPGMVVPIKAVNGTSGGYVYIYAQYSSPTNTLINFTNYTGSASGTGWARANLFFVTSD